MTQDLAFSDEARYRSEQQPFPWLLEKSNPSSRYLTLRDLFDGDSRDPQAAKAQAAIADWMPVRRILDAADSVDLWGRKTRPFYGGAISTQASLCLLADLGMPNLPIIRAACENLLQYGQLEGGGFSFDGSPDHMLLCHTGTSVEALVYFGFADDERVAKAVDYLAARATSPGGFSCPFCETESCQWGLGRSLAAFACLPKELLVERRQPAVEILAEGILAHRFDFKGKDANWLRLGFPLHYEAELSVLCDALARLGYGSDPRCERLMGYLLSARTDDGRWIKGQGTRALMVEQRGSPSKWITIRVLRTIRQSSRSQAQEARSRLHHSPIT